MDSLREHEVQTVQAQGWSGIKNGELLRRASEAGYDALITVDRGFEHQQNLSKLPLTVLLLRARSTRLDDLVDLIPQALERLSAAAPRTFLKVGV